MDLPDRQLHLATTGDEIYFRHVTAINHRDDKIEVVLARGKKAREIAVGSDGAAVIDILRARLRGAEPDSSNGRRPPEDPAVVLAPVLAPSASPIESDHGLARLQFAIDREEESRHCYLRSSKVQEYYSDPAVVNALVDQLQVPGTAATLNRMTGEEKRRAIETQIEHFRQTPNSFWYGVASNEILAASIWRARGNALTQRLIEDKFYSVGREDDLRRPVARWLAAQHHEPYMEIPLGRRRIDVLGHRNDGNPRLTAVELKNSDEQFRRGPDQMATFAEYAHAVYLAVTPAFGAEYLERNAENRNVNHWDASLLDRKLKQSGFGLLIVERDKVFEVIKPVEQVPCESRVAKVIAGLTAIQRVELD